jgi:hypothetical protein
VIDVAGTSQASAVDPATCRTGDNGAAQLCAVWTDPEHRADTPSAYYARVVEQPTCRWSTRACGAAGVDCAAPATIRPGWEDCCDPTFPKTIQERAWTSPVWYSPER